jgi:hypothetical protein
MRNTVLPCCCREAPYAFSAGLSPSWAYVVQNMILQSGAVDLSSLCASSMVGKIKAIPSTRIRIGIKPHRGGLSEIN